MKGETDGREVDKPRDDTGVDVGTMLQNFAQYRVETLGRVADVSPSSLPLLSRLVSWKFLPYRP